MVKDDGQIVLIDEKSHILCGTDLKWDYTPTDASIENGILNVTISTGEVYSYIIAL